MALVKRYPSNPITPHGSYYFLRGKKPTMVYRSYDDTIVFYLMGGMSIPDKVNSPESVRLKEMSGLIPPWMPIEQKGATQDGATFIDALYDPIDADMTVEVKGKTPERTAQIIRDWIAAWDAKKPGELSFFDQHAGRWWTAVRWTRNPVDKLKGGNFTQQTFTWPFKAHSGFWRSYDNTDAFTFSYEDFAVEFDTDYDDGLGPNWPLHYGGTGSGHLYSVGGQAMWKDDEDSLFFTGLRRVVNGPYVGYDTPTNEQSVTMEVGTTPEYTVGTGAANEVWLRMGRTGSAWNGNGVRGRIGWGFTDISVFVNFAETKIASNFELWPPVRGDRFTLTVPEGSRTFVLSRTNSSGTSAILTGTDAAAISKMDAFHLGIGFGMQAGAAVLTQATPAEVGSITVNGVEMDSFNVDHATNLGASWPQYYTGTGTPSDAYCRADTGEARWVDNSGTATQEVVIGPYREGGTTVSTTTDNQVVTQEFGSFQEWSIPESAENDLWARMGHNADGTWNGYGIRLRVENNIATLSYFTAFVPTQMAKRSLIFPALPGDKWKLVCGYQNEPRMFKAFRNNTAIFSHKEVGTGSSIGPAFRGIGFGMQAGGALITQATPASVRKVAGGDHNEVTQSGMLTRINMGDQVMWDRYTVYGPGTFYIGCEPESDQMVKYGPLLPGQVVQLRADPRKRGVVDLTSVPPSPQELTTWQKTIDDLLSFAGGNNSSPLLDQIKSMFGILPPQGNMYSLLDGRFLHGVPPPPAAGPPRTYSVLVEVAGGNADTKIVAAGTPLRRWPL